MNAVIKTDLSLSALEKHWSVKQSARCVSELNDTQAMDLRGVAGFPWPLKPRQRRALIKAIERRIAKIEKRERKEAELFERFHAWVNAKIGKCGAWVHALAHEGKEFFGSYSTKSRVIYSVRRNPELTMREQPYGDDLHSTAPAVFRGKPFPVENHEDQPLAI